MCVRIEVVDCSLGLTCSLERGPRICLNMPESKLCEEASGRREKSREGRARKSSEFQDLAQACFQLATLCTGMREVQQ